MKPTFQPVVYLGPDENNARRPILVFARGRIKYHAIVPRDKDIAIEKLDSLRHFTPLTRNGSEYPARRAASFWLNRDHRPITKRAKQVLRALVARKPREGETS